MGAVLAVATALRFTNLGANLPGLVAADEPVVVDRARLLLDGGGLRDFDWPPGAMYLLAALLRAAEAVWPGLVATAGGQYLFGRVVFALVGVACVALAVAVGHRVADPGRERATALATGLLLAVSYVSVRLSRQVHPDHLQLAAVLASFLAVLRFDATGRARWLAAAGTFAGLAAATKYVGGAVAVAAVAAVLLAPSPWRARARHLGVVALSVAGGVVLGAPVLLARPGDVWAGARFQLGHQAGGHLGYDQAGPSWGYHLVHTLPGNWGWPVTLLAVAGLVMAAARGSRPQRLAALVGLTFVALFGASGVRFPHYLIPALPFLGASAAVAGLRLAGRLGRRAAAAAVAVLAASVVPAAVDGARLVRASASPDTRLAAARVIAALPGPVRAERYATPTGQGSLGEQPDAPSCACFVAISSYMEDRYRREPDRYARQVAVYDALRRRARVVEVIAPSRPLRYDWDVLPAHGLSRLPLTGPVGRTGPTVTILDLRPVNRVGNGGGFRVPGGPVR